MEPWRVVMTGVVLLTGSVVGCSNISKGGVLVALYSDISRVIYQESVLTKGCITITTWPFLLTNT